MIAVRRHGFHDAGTAKGYAFGDVGAMAFPWVVPRLLTRRRKHVRPHCCPGLTFERGGMHNYPPSLILTPSRTALSKPRSKILYVISQPCSIPFSLNERRRASLGLGRRGWLW